METITRGALEKTYFFIPENSVHEIQNDQIELFTGIKGMSILTHDRTKDATFLQYMTF